MYTPVRRLGGARNDASASGRGIPIEEGPGLVEGVEGDLVSLEVLAGHPSPLWLKTYNREEEGNGRL